MIVIWILFAITIISSIGQIYFIKEAEHSQEITMKLLYIIGYNRRLYGL